MTVDTHHQPAQATPAPVSFDLISFDEPHESAPQLTPLRSLKHAVFEHRQWQLLTPSSVVRPPSPPSTTSTSATPSRTVPPDSFSTAPTPVAQRIPLPLSPPTTSACAQDSGPAKSPVSLHRELSAASLSPTAPAFARRISIKKSAEPLSFFSSSSHATPKPSALVGSPSLSTISSPSSPEAFRHLVHQDTSPSSYHDPRARTGLGLTPSPNLPTPYTFHGNVLVATGVQHRQLISPPIKRPVPIIPPPEQTSTSTPREEAKDSRSTTPFSSVKTVKSVLPDDAPEPEVEGVTEPASAMATLEDQVISKLARSLSQISIDSEEGHDTPTATTDEEPRSEGRATVHETIKLQTPGTRDADPKGRDREEREAYHDVLDDLRAGRDAVQKHLTRFFNDFDEDLSKLKQQQGPADLSISGSQEGLGADVEVPGDDGTAQKLVEMTARVEEVQAELVARELEKKDWTKQKAVLGQRYVRMEAKYHELEARVEQSDPPYSVIILEAEPRMFDHDLVKRGFVGGESVARNIHDRMRELQSLHGLPATTETYIMMFVDLPRVQRVLMHFGIVDDAASVNDFLEGLNEHHPLHCVVDIATGPSMWRKINGRLERYLKSNACSMILLGATTTEPYVATIAKVPRSLEKLHAVKTRAQDGWIDIVGESRIVPVPLLYPLDPETWEKRFNPSFDHDIGSVVKVPQSKPDPPEASLPSSPATVRARAFTPSPPPFAQPPPWEHVPAKSPVTSQSASHDGKTLPGDTPHRGSLLDQYYATRSASVDGSSRPEGTPSSASSKARIGGMKLLVPLRDPSQLESPPSSDEEHPSVQLPHSAQKFVQRPVLFADPEDEVEDEDGVTSMTSDTSLASPISKAPLASRISSTSLLSRMSGASFAPSEVSMAPTSRRSRASLLSRLSGPSSSHSGGLKAPTSIPSPGRDAPPHLQRRNGAGGAGPPGGASGGNTVPLGKRLHQGPPAATKKARDRAAR